MPEGVHGILPDLEPADWLGEPSYDTVNAVASVMATMLAQDPDAVLAVLTADQVIEPADTFQKGLVTAYAAVEREPGGLVDLCHRTGHSQPLIRCGASGRNCPGGFRCGLFCGKARP